jgi:hypothetical protein
MSYTVTLKAGRVFMHGDKYIVVLSDGATDRDDPPWVKIPVEAVKDGLISIEEQVADPEEAEDKGIRAAIRRDMEKRAERPSHEAPPPAYKADPQSDWASSDTDHALGMLDGMVDFTAAKENPMFRTGDRAQPYLISETEAAKIDNALTVLVAEGGFDAHISDILKHVSTFSIKNLNAVRSSFSANNRRRIANYVESKQGTRPPAGARPMLGPSLSAFVAGRDINPPSDLSKLARPGKAPTEAQLQMARDAVAADKSVMASLATRSAVESLRDVVPFGSRDD